MTDRLRVRADGVGFVYPYTKTELITDNDNITLDVLLAEINQRIELINQLHSEIKLTVEDGKIYIVDEENNILETYPSISEASRKMGVSVQTISECLNGKQKHSVGYKWKYADE